LFFYTVIAYVQVLVVVFEVELLSDPVRVVSNVDILLKLLAIVVYTDRLM
jgi:hypothetical protein